MKILKATDKGFADQFRKIIARNPLWKSGVEKSVSSIIEDVRRRGDRALLAATEKYDGVRLDPRRMEVTAGALFRAEDGLSRIDRAALATAVRRISSFHRRNLPRTWLRRSPAEGSIGQVIQPLSSVGIYVPGGKAAYPSTVLMNAIPARVAGVKNIIMVTPPSPGGINPTVLAAARMAGVTRVFTIGGAQAVAALAFGTRTIPRVDKIVGPGNIYVATAKKLLYSLVGVDLVAGPSEILVVCDESADPALVAGDMLSQAEHDEQAIAICVTTSQGHANKIKNHLVAQLRHLSRREIASMAIRHNGVFIIARDIAEAVDLANSFAPEHLELAVHDPFALLPRIRNAGSIFLGHLTPEAVGDYMAGPNHVLPTGGTARFFSPLGVEDFLKRSNVIFLNRKGLRLLGRKVAHLARLEGLDAHALSVERRMDT